MGSGGALRLPRGGVAGASSSEGSSEPGRGVRGV